MKVFCSTCSNFLHVTKTYLYQNSVLIKRLCCNLNTLLWKLLVEIHWRTCTQQTVIFMSVHALLFHAVYQTKKKVSAPNWKKSFENGSDKENTSQIPSWQKHQGWRTFSQIGLELLDVTSPKKTSFPWNQIPDRRKFIAARKNRNETNGNTEKARAFHKRKIKTSTTRLELNAKKNRWNTSKLSMTTTITDELQYSYVTCTNLCYYRHALCGETSPFISKEMHRHTLLLFKRKWTW